MVALLGFATGREVLVPDVLEPCVLEGG